MHSLSIPGVYIYIGPVVVNRVCLIKIPLPVNRAILPDADKGYYNVVCVITMTQKMAAKGTRLFPFLRFAHF